MELWQTYHEISKRFHLTADNWGVTKKSVVSQFSSFGKEEYPQGEVVGEYAVHLFTANYRQPYFTYHPDFQPPFLPEGRGMGDRTDFLVTLYIFYYSQLNQRFPNHLHGIPPLKMIMITPVFLRLNHRLFHRP